MLIKNFIFTTMYILIVFCQIVSGTTIRYKYFKENKPYSFYADFALFREAAKDEINTQLSVGKFIAPIVILIDLTLLWMK